MYSLLIADDEALEREGLELMIRHMMPDTFTFLHAENGRRAIQIAEEKRPDFIFMDIKMPGIQGLEAVREIMSKDPAAKIVIVTAHDYFSYAKEGLALGVRGYLLKPASTAEVQDTLTTLIAEWEEEKRARNDQLALREKLSQLMPLAENELSLMLMLECVQEVELEQLAGLLDLQWHKGYAMVLSYSRRTKKELETFQLVKKEIYEAVKQMAKPNLSCMVSPVVGYQMALFIPFPPGKPAYSQRVVSLEWGEKIRCFIEERFQVPLSVGIGSIREGWDGMNRSYREALRVCADDSDIVSVRHYDDITQSLGRKIISLDDEKKLLDALLRFDKQDTTERFSLLFDRLEQSEPRSFPRLRGEVVGLLLFLSRGARLGDGAELISTLGAAEDAETLRSGAVLWLGTLIDGMKEEKEQSRSSVLQRALLYIDEKYKEDISMEQCAEFVNLSPYYFSKLFKLQTGETFIDYVTRLRIDEAKKLIAEQNLSLKEICYEVGYNDPNYFSRVFKKAMGIPPSEYRQQAGAKSLFI
ncbi:helix-turn-helix domain-containing protein [Paenibacillus physcomitrellae]|uniref:AraC family transcriptional regulator n=1 Tax=Paenibacillus physcomitrellae TaxID=1619311 RepID=A0ABQ1GIH3_9BACL|nr:helix-turn-helix domain-containing protein [Paenibacillus physcomitrellae]GGA44284.1 AraC family transcriptional regulator [Paenibacillus physcomitrellae]